MRTASDPDIVVDLGICCEWSVGAGCWCLESGTEVRGPGGWVERSGDASEILFFSSICVCGFMLVFSMARCGTEGCMA